MPLRQSVFFRNQNCCHPGQARRSRARAGTYRAVFTVGPVYRVCLWSNPEARPEPVGSQLQEAFFFESVSPARVRSLGLVPDSRLGPGIALRSRIQDWIDHDARVCSRH
jgi:hypothetical protein